MTSLPKGVELFLPDPPFYPVAKVFSWWEQSVTAGVPLSHASLTAQEVVERLRALADAIEGAIRPGSPSP